MAVRRREIPRTERLKLVLVCVQPRVVMEVLGHSQVSVTTDVYSHVMPTALREAAEAADRALGLR